MTNLKRKRKLPIPPSRLQPKSRRTSYVDSAYLQKVPLQTISSIKLAEGARRTRPEPSFNYLTDSQGNYLTDNRGNYLVTQFSED